MIFRRGWIRHIARACVLLFLRDISDIFIYYTFLSLASANVSFFRDTLTERRNVITSRFIINYVHTLYAHRIVLIAGCFFLSRCAINYLNISVRKTVSGVTCFVTLTHLRLNEIPLRALTKSLFLYIDYSLSRSPFIIQIYYLLYLAYGTWKGA